MSVYGCARTLGIKNVSEIMFLHLICKSCGFLLLYKLETHIIMGMAIQVSWFENDWRESDRLFIV